MAGRTTSRAPADRRGPTRARGFLHRVAGMRRLRADLTIPTSSIRLRSHVPRLPAHQRPAGGRAHARRHRLRRRAPRPWAGPPRSNRHAPSCPPWPPTSCWPDLQLADGWVAASSTSSPAAAATAGPKTLLATLSLDDSQLLNALARGADGYFVQGLSPNMLIATVEQVLAGGAEMAPVIAAAGEGALRRLGLDREGTAGRRQPACPDRIERQVLQWICDGFLPHEIARPAHQHARWRSDAHALPRAAPGPAHRVAVAQLI